MTSSSAQLLNEPTKPLLLLSLSPYFLLTDFPFNMQSLLLYRSLSCHDAAAHDTGTATTYDAQSPHVTGRGGQAGEQRSVAAIPSDRHRDDHHQERQVGFPKNYAPHPMQIVFFLTHSRSQVQCGPRTGLGAGEAGRQVRDARPM